MISAMLERSYKACLFSGAVKCQWMQAVGVAVAEPYEQYVFIGLQITRQ